MIQPCHHFGNGAKHLPGRHGGPVDQDDGQAKAAGGRQLGLGPGAAGVLGDNMGDPVILQKSKVGGQVKGAAGDDSMGIWQGQGAFGRVDKAQDVVVPGPGSKGLQGLLADGKKDPCGRIGQGSDGGFGIWHMGPLIAFPGAPRRALQRHQRQVQLGAGGDSIPAHPRGEGMGRIDDMGDALILQVSNQPFHAAKAAHPHGQGLRHGHGRAPGVGKDRIRPCLGQGAGKQACLGRAAQKKDAWHG